MADIGRHLWRPSFASVCSDVQLLGCFSDVACQHVYLCVSGRPVPVAGLFDSGAILDLALGR